MSGREIRNFSRSRYFSSSSRRGNRANAAGELKEESAHQEGHQRQQQQQQQEQEQERARAIRLAVAAAQASLFGTSTPEGARAIQELSAAADSGGGRFQAARPSSSSSSSSTAASQLPQQWPLRPHDQSPAPLSDSAGQRLPPVTTTQGTSGAITTEKAPDSGGSTMTVPTDDDVAQAAVAGDAGASRSPPAPSSTSPAARGIITPPVTGEVICEVSDLSYSIDLPARNGAGVGSRLVRAAANCFRDLRGAKGGEDASALSGVVAGGVADASTVDAGGLGDWVQQPARKRALLQGVSCRVCAGDMVAVIVSWIWVLV